MPKAKNIVEKARPSSEVTSWYYVMPQANSFSSSTYSIDLISLANDYTRYVNMTDEEFENNLLTATHFAVFVAYYKNLKPIDSISDEGVVHQLIHLMQFKNSGLQEDFLYKRIFPKARESFKKLLEIELPKQD